MIGERGGWEPVKQESRLPPFRVLYFAMSRDDMEIFFGT